MTHPWGTNPGTPGYLDRLATEAVHAATGHRAPTPRPVLTEQEKREAGDLVRQGQTCRFCAGLHVGASGPACPRLAAGKLNGDGDVVEFSFWPDGQWDQSRVVFVADVTEDAEVETEGDDA